MEPEDSQGLGHSGSGQQDVSASQHGEEDIHGFMERVFMEDNEDKGSISQDGSDVHETEWDGKPGVVVLQSQDAKQDEHSGMEDGEVSAKHTCFKNL